MELSSTVQFLNKAFQSSYKGVGVKLYFKEYKNEDSEYSIDHFHVHVLPCSLTDEEKEELNIILEEDDKDFILNYKKKIDKKGPISEKNIEELAIEVNRIKDLLFPLEEDLEVNDPGPYPLQ